jgi:hypothetical protein
MRLTQLGRAVFVAMFAAVFFVLLAPGCGRTSLEPEFLGDGGPVTAVCGPQNCPGGCCDADGTCRTGGDTRACGTGGNRCNDCVAQGFDSCSDRKVCGRDVTTCSAATCPSGCCAIENGRPRCLAGIDGTACGGGGDACTDCAAEGRSCEVDTRECSAGTCDASNCAGCCVGDLCLQGSDVASCGAAGEQCTTCAAGQICRSQPGGGGQCEGVPSCGPQNCGGCCTPQGQCVAGSDSIACGRQGQACQACGAGQVCGAGRTCETPPACGPQNCAGCCAGNTCVIATTPAACGRGGEACRACGGGEACNAGVCEAGAKCGPTNCGGCCLGDDICAVGAQDTACGAGGTQCANCAGQTPPRVCQGGTCQPPTCGPANCAGCCAGNTCVVGTQDNACGLPNGQACADCTSGNRVCVGRQCRDKCGPGNCAGCCSGNNCVPGFANNACGSSGATCTNCTADGSTCNGLVTPRVCANQQDTCPAAYPTCPAGVTTAITPSRQERCSDADLDALATACATGANTATCVSAMQVLQATNPACAGCVRPFNRPFTQLAGLYLCAAPFLNAPCNRSTGCAVDCADTSCEQCPAASETQCRNQVNQGGQCTTYVQQTACATAALGNGQLCAPQTYGGNYGQWLRAVGDHFCGDGP